jgi:hypothetical protein
MSPGIMDTGGPENDYRSTGSSWCPECPEVFGQSQIQPGMPTVFQPQMAVPAVPVILATLGILATVGVVGWRYNSNRLSYVPVANPTLSQTQPRDAFQALDVGLCETRL